MPDGLQSAIQRFPEKRAAIEGYGLSITEHVPIEIMPGPHNRRYLETKRDKLGHTLRH